MKRAAGFALTVAMLVACKEEVEQAQCRSFCGSPVYTQASCEEFGKKSSCETSTAIPQSQGPACRADGGPVPVTGCDFAHCTSAPECGQ